MKLIRIIKLVLFSTFCYTRYLGVALATLFTFLAYNPNIDQPAIYEMWLIFYLGTRLFGWVWVQIVCKPICRLVLKDVTLAPDYDTPREQMLHSHSVWQTEGSIITTTNGTQIKSVYRGASMGGNTYDFDLKVQRKIAFDYLYYSI